MDFSFDIFYLAFLLVISLFIFSRNFKYFLQVNFIGFFPVYFYPQI